MTCPHDCFCHVEGARGLEGEGDGSASNPFFIEPAARRSIPRVVDTAGDLPIEAAEEDGQLGFTNDTGLLYRFNGSTLAWEGVGPEWHQTYPADLDVDGATGVYVTAAESLTLTPGFWFMKANGVLQGSIDAPTTSGVVSQSLNTVDVDVEIFEPVGPTLFDATRMTLDNMAFEIAEGVFGFDRNYNIPWDLQNITAVTSTITVQMRAKRSADGFAMGLTLSTEDLVAIRMANHEFTV